MDAIQMIEAQQQGKENTPAWMVGEQLKDICRAEPDSAKLVREDLGNPGNAGPLDAFLKKLLETMQQGLQVTQLRSFQ